MKVLLLIAAIVGVVCGEGFNIRYKQCYRKPTPAEIKGINVDPCPEAAGKRPCVLHKGGASTIALDFVSKQGAEKVWMTLKGKIGFVWVPFKSVNMCETGAIQCPVKPGQQYKAKITIPILKAYPTLKLAISVQIQDENSTDLSCAIFPVQIK